MNRCNSLPVDILASWQIQYPVEVRLEQIHLSPLAPFLVAYSVDQHRSKGQRHAQRRSSREYSSATLSCKSATSSVSSQDNGTPRSGVANHRHYVSGRRSLREGVASRSCGGEEDGEPEEILGFRVIGRLTVNNQSVCEPACSELAHLEFKCDALKRETFSTSSEFGVSHCGTRSTSPENEDCDALASRSEGSRTPEERSGRPCTSRSQMSDPEWGTLGSNRGLDNRFLRTSVNEERSKGARSSHPHHPGKLRSKRSSRMRRTHRNPLLAQCCTINFSSVLTFLYNISDLPLSAVLDLSVFCVDLGLLVGRIFFPLFGPSGVLRKGRFLLPFSTAKSRGKHRSRNDICSRKTTGRVPRPACGHKDQSVTSVVRQLPLLNSQPYVSFSNCNGVPVSEDEEESAFTASSDEESLGSAGAHSLLTMFLDQGPTVSTEWLSRNKKKTGEPIYHGAGGTMLHSCSTAIADATERERRLSASVRGGGATVLASTLASEVKSSLEDPIGFFSSVPSSKYDDDSHEPVNSSEADDSDGVLISSCSMASWLSCTTDDSPELFAGSSVLKEVEGSVGLTDENSHSTHQESIASAPEQPSETQLDATGDNASEDVEPATQETISIDQYSLNSERGGDDSGWVRDPEISEKPVVLQTLSQSSIIKARSFVQRDGDKKHRLRNISPLLKKKMGPNNCQPCPNDWVRVQSLRSVKRAVCRAMNCYKMLDLLARRAVAPCPYSGDVCRRRVERICEKSVVYSLSHFGYVAICLPTFGSPVLYSPASGVASVYRMQAGSGPSIRSSSRVRPSYPLEPSILLSSSYTSHHGALNWPAGTQGLNQQEKTSLPGPPVDAHNYASENLSSSLPAADVEKGRQSSTRRPCPARFLSEECCHWFLDSWTPLRFDRRQATLLWASGGMPTYTAGWTDEQQTTTNSSEVPSVAESSACGLKTATEASSLGLPATTDQRPGSGDGPQADHGASKDIPVREMRVEPSSRSPEVLKSVATPQLPRASRLPLPWKGEGGGPMQFIYPSTAPAERLYREQWHQLHTTACEREQQYHYASTQFGFMKPSFGIAEERVTRNASTPQPITQQSAINRSPWLYTQPPKVFTFIEKNSGPLPDTPYAPPLGLSQPPYSEFQYVMNLVSLPAFSSLTAQDKHVLWKYRDLLKARGVGLFKLCCCVKWEAVPENAPPSDMVTEFFHLLESWPAPSIDAVLELLSPLSTVPAVRRFALKGLEQISDSQLYRFLPQLIQAARYDPPGSVSGTVLNFLINRSTRSALIASHVHWGLLCESEDPHEGHLFIRGHQRLIDALSNPEAGAECKRAWRVIELQKKLVRQLRSLASQIRGKRDRADRKTERLRTLIAATARTRRKSVSVGSPNATAQSVGGSSSAGTTERCVQHDAVASSKGTMEELNLVELECPIPLPISPHAILLGIIPEESSVVRSSQYPIVLACRVLLPPTPNDQKPFTQVLESDLANQELLSSSTPPSTQSQKSSYEEWSLPGEELKQRGYKEIVKRYLFKSGDDLRQDQLVTQFVGIIHSLLINYGCDYCLTLYNVASFSRNDGLIEFIEDSEAISSIKRVYPTLRQYFASSRPLPSSPLGFPRQILDTFIRSCSGFSVITFLLAVGDRHLDNLMVSREGRLFHVDFGFILGDDPKPFPPPMKLCSEMIEALGGIGSQGYTEFQLRCCQCFRCLRRHSKLILDILLLMVGSGIRGLRQDPLGVIARVHEKFQLEVSEVEAEAYLLDVVAVSANALLPAVVDKFHEWSVYWK